MKMWSNIDKLFLVFQKCHKNSVFSNIDFDRSINARIDACIIQSTKGTQQPQQIWDVLQQLMH